MSPATMPFAVRAERHGGLAGDHPCPGSQSRAPTASPKARHRVDEFEPGPYRTLGVVLLGRRHTPYRHHRVADELLDGAAVAADDRPRRREVLAQQLADILRIALSDSAVKPTRSANSTLT